MGSDRVAAPVRQRLAAATSPHEHLVGFYETDAFLVDSAVQFLAAGLHAGDAAVIVATPAHCGQLQQALARHDLAPAAARAQGQLIMLDAAQALVEFMVEGLPDPDRFHRMLGPVLERAGQGGRGVRIFGEMVALLWDDGRVPAASALEDLWNELAESHAFGLLCMYPTSAVNTEDRTLAFLTVCEQHAGVIPSESYSALDTLDDRLRRVALLQQEAIAARTDRLALRRRQQEQERELEQLRARDAARNQLLGMVAHDVRNPAAAVTGLLTLLQDADLDSDQRWALARAVANVDRIGRLSDDLLRLTALESGQFTFALHPVDLARIVEQAAADVGAATGRCIRVTCPVELPAALADRDRQRQILDNLLINAVTFSPGTSTVRVDVTAGDGHLVVDVRDHGVGIDQDDLDQLFQPFSQLSERTDEGEQGTGLGLYITRRLVEGQGGDIWADSTRDQGSTFTYTVPTAP